MKSLKTTLAVISLSVLVTACSTPHKLDQRVDEQNYTQVSLPIESQAPTEEPIRTWLGQDTSYLYSEETNSTPITVSGDQLNVLVLSGGGAKGSFGAGVIKGLNDTNALPNYSIITGVSAGALLAPFVFVGGEQIDRLEEVMLGLNDKMILGKRNFLNTIFKDAFTNGEDLFSFIEKVYDDEMIAQVAAQHNQGRRLLIGTTHFDSEQMIVWNLGQIAASNDPDKAKLFHQVLVASASIPGVFPPQFINVDLDGQTLEEMHVDGGLSAQMFLQASNIDFMKINQALGLEKAPKVQVIRNGVLKMPYNQIKDKGMDLLTQSVRSLTLQQTRGDLYRMMYFSEVQGLDLEFTYIDDRFTPQAHSKQMFDSTYMKALYNYGYSKATKNQLWTTDVPY